MNTQSSPVLDGSFQFTSGASGLIGVLDMFGFENSEVRSATTCFHSTNKAGNRRFVTVVFITSKVIIFQSS